MLAVGDQVVVSHNGHKQGIVDEILPRRSALARPDPSKRLQAAGDRRQRRPTADRGRVAESGFWPELVDRYLIAALRHNLAPVIAINKVDLAEDRWDLEGIAQAYRLAGCQVILTSAVDGLGLDELRAVLAGRTTALAGPVGRRQVVAARRRRAGPEPEGRRGERAAAGRAAHHHAGQPAPAGCGRLRRRHARHPRVRAGGPAEARPACASTQSSQSRPSAASTRTARTPGSRGAASSRPCARASCHACGWRATGKSAKTWRMNARLGCARGKRGFCPGIGAFSGATALHVTIVSHGTLHHSTCAIIEQRARRPAAIASVDPPLTELGLRQAELVAKHLANGIDHETHAIEGQPADAPLNGMRISRLYCSAMLRALQTAQIIGAALGLAPQVWVDVHEEGGMWLDHGEVEGIRGYPGMTRAEIAERFPECVLPDADHRAGLVALWAGGSVRRSWSEPHASPRNSSAGR